MGAVLCLTAACGDDYDDTELWQKVNEHEERLAALEEWQEETNSNLAALQELLNANDMITSVTPLTEGGETVGYTIAFLRSEPVTIYNGTKGEAGATPLIGLKEGEDGNWYWTLNGELMTDTDGDPIRANGEDGDDGSDGRPGSTGPQGPQGEPGKDAVAPQVRINEDTNEWEISTDGGRTWTSTEVKATGESGESLFASVDTTDPDYVTFTLADGTTSFQVPRYQPLTIGTGDGSLEVTAGGTTDITLSFEGEYASLVARLTPEGADGTFTAIDTRTGDNVGGWSVTADLENKKVTVTAPATGGKALLDVSLIRADGGKVTASRVLEAPIVKDGETLTEAGTYTMSGTYTQGVTINGDGINLTLYGATINTSGIGINITGGNPTIQVSGTENSVTSRTNTAVAVASGASVTITGINGKTDKLTVKGGGTNTVWGEGGAAGAGIGAATSATAGGDIIIENVTIDATGATTTDEDENPLHGGAGIGCSGPGCCGDITITNATITAKGGYHSAAIGMGYSAFLSTSENSKMGNISITRSEITATSGSGAAVIGFAYTDTYQLEVTGGTITIATDESADTFLSRLTIGDRGATGGTYLPPYKIGKGGYSPDIVTVTFGGVTLTGSDGTQTSADGIAQWTEGQ